MKSRIILKEITLTASSFAAKINLFDFTNVGEAIFSVAFNTFKEDEIMKPISERLANFFKDKELSQKNIAEMMGTSAAYVNAILNGRKSLRESPSADKLSAILAAFPELSKIWLLTGEGEMLNAPAVEAASGNAGTVPAGLHARALEELSKTRKLLERALRDNREQADRFLSVIESLSQK